jgi:hypothetical protein
MNWRKKVTSEEEKKTILAASSIVSRHEVIPPEPVHTESVHREEQTFSDFGISAALGDPVSIPLAKPKKPTRDSYNLSSTNDFPALGAGKKSKKKNKAMNVDVPMNDSDAMDVVQLSWIEIAKKGEAEAKAREEIERIEKEERERVEREEKAKREEKAREYNQSMDEYAEYVDYTSDNYDVEYGEYYWDEQS